MSDPILKIEEYDALLAAGKLTLRYSAATGDLTIKIDRGEADTLKRVAVIAWLDAKIAGANATIALLNRIKTAVNAAT